MNKLCFLIILFLACRICNAQNLVPNGGFESYSQLPNGAGEYSYCIGWNNCYGYGSPDYFHMNGGGGTQLPNCFASFLLPHSGSAVMAICLKNLYPNWANFREYISRSLLSPLIVGQSYHLSFYINNGTPPLFYGGYACDHFSVAFSTVQLMQSTSLSSLVINFNPQFIYNGFLYNNNWQHITFNFVADSAYQFITFGSFVDDAIQQIQLIDSASIGPAVYYFIDDVCISTDSLFCNSAVGINQIKNEEATIFFPNPFINTLTINLKSKGEIEIILYDIASRKLLQKKFTNSVSLNTEQLTKGIYFYEVKNKNGVIEKGKVVKE